MRGSDATDAESLMSDQYEAFDDDPDLDLESMKPEQLFQYYKQKGTSGGGGGSDQHSKRLMKLLHLNE